MKILVLADAESKYLWDYFDKKKLEGIDLIISCGDLAPQYLVHGHVHSNYGRDFVRESRYLDTTIINAFEKYIIEIDETALQAAK